MPLDNTTTLLDDPGLNIVASRKVIFLLLAGLSTVFEEALNLIPVHWRPERGLRCASIKKTCTYDFNRGGSNILPQNCYAKSPFTGIYPPPPPPLYVGPNPTCDAPVSDYSYSLDGRSWAPEHRESDLLDSTKL